MKLAIDIDGCLANFTHAFGDLLIEDSGVNLLGPDWKNDPGFPGTWNWHHDAGYNLDQIGRAWRYVAEGETFWRDLKPLDSAAATIQQLNRLAGWGHDVYYVTHRAGKKAKRQTEEWLNSFGMEHPTVILSGQKMPILVATDVNFFIDDKPDTVNEVYRNMGQDITVFLKDAPYNRADRPLGLRVVDSVADALKAIELWQEPKRGRPKVLVP